MSREVPHPRKEANWLNGIPLMAPPGLFVRPSHRIDGPRLAVRPNEPTFIDTLYLSMIAGRGQHTRPQFTNVGKARKWDPCSCRGGQWCQGAEPEILLGE